MTNPVYADEWYKEDIEEYLQGVDVSKMTDEHWNNISIILRKWDIVDEDTLWDIVDWYEGTQPPLPMLP